MKTFFGVLLGTLVLGIVLSGCGPSEEGDPRVANPNLNPSSTPGTTAGSTKETPGPVPTPGETAGGSGTGTTAPSSAGG